MYSLILMYKPTHKPKKKNKKWKNTQYQMFVCKCALFNYAINSLDHRLKILFIRLKEGYTWPAPLKKARICVDRWQLCKQWMVQHLPSLTHTHTDTRTYMSKFSSWSNVVTILLTLDCSTHTNTRRNWRRVVVVVVPTKEIS